MTPGLPVGPDVPGWTPRPWPNAVRLAGRHVVLEPLAVEHADALHASLCGPDDDDLWTYRVLERPTSPAAMRAHVEQHLAEPAMEPWAVVPTTGASAGRAAGLTTFMRIEPAHGRVEVAGVLYGRHLQRTPASTEATHLLMRWAFDGLGYRRFECRRSKRGATA